MSGRCREHYYGDAAADKDLARKRAALSDMGAQHQFARMGLQMCVVARVRDHAYAPVVL
ncbi:MAG: hypothetical protein ACREQX_06965 [Candidatus Binataceae bacterium]